MKLTQATHLLERSVWLRTRAERVIVVATHERGKVLIRQPDGASRFVAPRHLREGYPRAAGK
jgi:hypothetical protein